jgi:hypothetical protein
MVHLNQDYGSGRRNQEPVPVILEKKPKGKLLRCPFTGLIALRNINNAGQKKTERGQRVIGVHDYVLNDAICAPVLSTDAGLVGIAATLAPILPGVADDVR